jgi:NADH dehydrogenase
MSKPISTVAVTGATGFVGREMVRALAGDGYSVRALVRSRGRANEALGELLDSSTARVEVVEGDVLDPATARELVRGAQACVNLVGIIREDRRRGVTFARMHVDAPRVLTHACRNEGVKRFIHMSALGASPTGVSEYQRSKFEGEQAVRRVGLEWTVLRPSLIHGTGSEFIRMARKWCLGAAAPFVFLPYFTGGSEDQRVPLGGVNPTDPRVAPVSVEDVCDAFVRALRAPASVGEIYNLCGSEVLTWPQMLRHMKKHIPGALPGLEPFGIPSEFAAIKARVAKMLGMGQFLPFDEGMARMSAEDSTADTTKAREHLGWIGQPFREGFATYAARIA